MILTPSNYFTAENKYLSNSKINDWFKCHNYFYKKHITHELVEDKTGAMVTGGAVDNILTDMKNISDGKYVVRQFNGTTKEGKEETIRLREQGKTILTQKEYDDIMGMAIAVSETSAYKDLKDHKAQDILHVDMEIGPHFAGLCGIPDWYTIVGDMCIITDLKTSRVIEEKRYYYHAREYGYFRQLALYGMMLQKLHPEIEEFVYRHLVVCKDKNVWTVKAFIIDGNEVKKAAGYICDAIEQISNEKDFKKEDASWESAKLITNPQSTTDWFEGEEE